MWYSGSAGRDSAVGTTRYGVRTPKKAISFLPVEGPPSFLHIWYQVSFPGLKQAGRTVKHPPHIAPLGLHDALCITGDWLSVFRYTRTHLPPAPSDMSN